jgi:glycosyltransferase involved in cell wall biosynthesis
MVSTPVVTIYNGFDPDDYKQIRSKPRKYNKKFTIVYTGTIYRGFRDPSPLFTAISSLKQEGLISSDNLSIVFAGMDADVSDIAKKYNLSDCYLYLGLLPREEALQLQYDADVVLFLEYNNPSAPGILTGKLFEYLYIARDILAVGIDDNILAGKLIIDAKAGICCENNVEKMKHYLKLRLTESTSHDVEKNYNIIDNFSREKQAQRMLQYIK